MKIKMFPFVQQADIMFFLKKNIINLIILVMENTFCTI